MGETISVASGRVALAHDERSHMPNNADKMMSKYNTYIKTCDNLHEEFNRVFEEEVSRYNSTQKRSDRKIKDYYEEITKSDRKEKPCYEYVFQIGNKFSNPTTIDEQGRGYWYPTFELDQKGRPHRTGYTHRGGKRTWGTLAKKSEEILKEFAQEFEEKFPQFKVVSSVIHMDEQTPHLHIAFIPIAHGYKQKMKTRCSLTKALTQMGFNNSDAKNLAVTQWKHKCEELIEEKMLARGIDRAYGDGRTDRYDIQTYKGITEEVEHQAEKKLCKVASQVCDQKKELEEVKQELDDVKSQVENESSNLAQKRAEVKKESETLSEIKQEQIGANLKLMQTNDKVEALENKYKALEEAPPQIKEVVNYINEDYKELAEMYCHAFEGMQTVAYNENILGTFDKALEKNDDYAIACSRMSKGMSL